MAKLKFRKPARGENSGKGFFISTFRFDLPLAQSLERISLAEGVSLSQVINQILQGYVDSVEVPKLKVVRTLHPTTWANGQMLSKEDKAPGAKPIPPKADKKASKKSKAPAKPVDEMSDAEVDAAADEMLGDESANVPEAAPEVEAADDDLAVQDKPAGAAAAFGALKKKASIDDEIPED